MSEYASYVLTDLKIDSSGRSLQSEKQLLERTLGERLPNPNFAPNCQPGSLLGETGQQDGSSNENHEHGRELPSEHSQQVVLGQGDFGLRLGSPPQHHQPGTLQQTLQESHPGRVLNRQSEVRLQLKFNIVFASQILIYKIPSHFFVDCFKNYPLSALKYCDYKIKCTQT